MQGRAVTSIARRDSDNLILAAYGPSELQVWHCVYAFKLPKFVHLLGKWVKVEVQLQDAWHANLGCLCLWDLSEPTEPITSLISEGCPTACTFLGTSGAGSLVLAAR